MALTAYVVVAVRQPEAASLAPSQRELSRRGTTDLGGAGEYACRSGLGSGRGARSRHTAAGTGRASPCDYAAVSGWSWCRDSADIDAASVPCSTGRSLRPGTFLGEGLPNVPKLPMENLQFHSSG